MTLLLASLLGCPGPSPEAVVLGSSCLQSQCHAAVEQIHYGGPDLSCVNCHGGDNTQPSKQGAHVTVDVSFNPSSPGRSVWVDPSMQQLDALDPAIIKFLNPADYRVARQTCGGTSMGGALCHPSIVDTSLLMNRATLAGQLAGGGFLAGAQDKEGRYGAVGATDLQTPAQIPDGFLGRIKPLPGDVPDSITDPIARAFYPIYEQQCVVCHINHEGLKVPGRYYSSGCAACHMVTEDDARARTRDITQDVDELGHVSSHRFTNLVPDKQCAHCHISHLGRSLLAIGVRDRSEPEGDEKLFDGPNRGVEDPENAVPWSQENYTRFQGDMIAYDKPYPYYIEDEDGSNQVDESPPDIHTERGLGCIDCHNIRESHGDDGLADRMDSELDVRCESCHGRPGARGSLRSDAGLGFTQSLSSRGGIGLNRPVFEQDSDGNVLQRGRFTRALHPVTQITERVDPGSSTFNPRTQMGCGLHAGTAATRQALKQRVNAAADADPASVASAFPGLPEGFRFDLAAEERAGRVECFTCHNAWTINCYGCHMVVDDRETYVSQVDGKTKPGKSYSFGLSVVSDALALGFNGRGKVSPMLATSIFFTHIDGDGVPDIDAVPLTDGYGNAGDGNVHNPVHHHTVRKIPRDCQGCHPTSDGTQDDDALLTATGIGSGRYTFEDGSGKLHLLDRQLAIDIEGDGIVDQPSALPAHVDSATSVISSTHRSGEGTPGPLDTETLNLLLDNVVVSQRGVDGGLP